MKEMMKTIDRLAILCILALAACGQKGGDDPIIPDPEDVVETRTLTFVLPEYNLGAGEIPAGFKTAWKAGDQIVVHGEYAKDQVTVTLDAGDIAVRALLRRLHRHAPAPARRSDSSLHSYSTSQTTAYLFSTARISNTRSPAGAWMVTVSNKSDISG